MNKNELYAQERNRVINITPNQQVIRHLAEEMIQKSAYWYGHPCGYPVRTPKHSKNVNDPISTMQALEAVLGCEQKSTFIKSDCQIKFGANIFLISKAIYRCQSTLLEFLDNAEAGNVLTLSKLKYQLKMNVRKSVANHQGQEYEGYYSAFDGNHIIFGTQSISTDDFVNVILSKVNIHRIFKSNISTPPSTKLTSAKSSANFLKSSKHANNSLSSQIKCPYCGAKVKTTKLKTHKESRCPKRPL
jgi:hypothetical protein